MVGLGMYTYFSPYLPLPVIYGKVVKTMIGAYPVEERLMYQPHTISEPPSDPLPPAGLLR